MAEGGWATGGGEAALIPDLGGSHKAKAYQGMCVREEG